MSNLEQHHDYDPLRRVLNGVHTFLEQKNEIRGDSIYCPDWDMTIKPRIEQCEEQLAVVGFYISAPDFDEQLYECCASTGKDTDTAIGSCIGSFVFAFMSGITQMENSNDCKTLNSSFAGKTHTWKVYNSDVVGMGENVDDNEKTVSSKYWNMLKEHIAKRLGNQKMCYVKIFASKAIGKKDTQTVGEVRINDVPSAELSEIVKKHAEKWNVSQFASQKQFFFFKQDNCSESPYSGENGKLLLKSKVKTALDFVNEIKTDTEYKKLPEKLKNALGDTTLAWECYSFIPEICAEHAFSQAEFPETLQIAIGDNEKTTCYRNQLADFHAIGKAIFDLFSSGVFGKNTDTIYSKLINSSATYNCIRQFLDKGNKIEDCSMTAILYNFPSGFELR